MTSQGSCGNYRSSEQECIWRSQPLGAPPAPGSSAALTLQVGSPLTSKELVWPREPLSWPLVGDAWWEKGESGAFCLGLKLEGSSDFACCSGWSLGQSFVGIGTLTKAHCPPSTGRSGGLKALWAIEQKSPVDLHVEPTCENRDLEVCQQPYNLLFSNAFFEKLGKRLSLIGFLLLFFMKSLPCNEDKLWKTTTTDYHFSESDFRHLPV